MQLVPPTFFQKKGSFEFFLYVSLLTHFVIAVRSLMD
jgi:hypothetical protein